MLILKQRYSDIKKEIPDSNYQTICIDLKYEPAFEGDTCGGQGYLKSVQEVPSLLPLSTPRVSTMDYFQGTIYYTNRERFKYVGNNKYLQNSIYSTIAPDDHLYIKSNNAQAYHLEKVKVTGIFEDSAKAAELSCDGDGKCDILDRKFALEEALIPVMVEMVVKELLGAAYRPRDSWNDAADNLADLATFLRQNMKSGFQKAIDNGV